jgi:hypothetical protein
MMMSDEDIKYRFNPEDGGCMFLRFVGNIGRFHYV